jgi:hypothetical protein
MEVRPETQAQLPEEAPAGQSAGQSRYFHGGIAGLSVGERILPAAATGTRSASGDQGAPYRNDRVYLTTVEAEALDYARFCAVAAWSEWTAAGSLGAAPAGGAVYEVEPVGDLERDVYYAGYWPGTTFAAAAATVVRIVRTVRFNAVGDLSCA